MHICSYCKTEMARHGYENVAQFQKRRFCSRTCGYHAIAERQGKLTPDNVRSIRAEVATGATTNDLARRFGVTPATISSIKVGRIWSHV